jgi:hypothetical protein
VFQGINTNSSIKNSDLEIGHIYSISELSVDLTTQIVLILDKKKGKTAWGTKFVAIKFLSKEGLKLVLLTVEREIKLLA